MNLGHAEDEIISAKVYRLFGIPHLQTRNRISPKSIRLFFHTLILFFFLTAPLPLSASPIDSLSYKIGQMVMTGFYPGNNFEDTLYYDIEHRNLGGVILMNYNLESPEQISNLTTSLQSSADVPLFIATDQEGGTSARLDENNGFARTKDAVFLGHTDNENTSRSQAALMANWLASSGINTNLAPVADVNINPASPAIGYYGRSFSADPFIVSKQIYYFYEEMKNKSIITSLKHFPGHGSAKDDSHDGFTDITNTWSEQELIPYTSMIDTGYMGMIMTAHLYNAHIDSSYPATLSKPTLTGILRDSLGFEGVIITDDMRMGAISNIYGFVESVTKAIDAGADILLYCGNEKYGKSVLKQIIKVVKSAIAEGKISESRINESYKRIMKLKKEIHLSHSAIDPTFITHYELKTYPNPFNPRLSISLNIKQDLYEVTFFNLYSIDGKLVQRYPLSIVGYGKYLLYWDGKDFNGNILPSGTYLYSTKINNQIISGKVSFLK